MKAPNKAFAAVIALAVTILACRGPFRAEPSAVPLDNAVNTRVAATLEAQQAHEVQQPQPSRTASEPTASPAPVEQPTVQPSPTSAPSLLPSGLYFIARDPSGRDQVWRLAPDGVSLSQVTSEPVDVTDFDVTAGGEVAYLANNQLLLVRSDGSNRRLLIDGGPNDGTESWSYTRAISSPRWSPNGQTLAYGQNGLNLFDVAQGGTRLVMPNNVRNQDGFLFPDDLFAPSLWSPDGGLLIVDVGHYEGLDKGVFNPANGAFVVLRSPEQPTVCCTTAWAPDGNSIYSAGFYYGGMSSELWRFDAATGAGTKLIPEISPADGTYNYADWPHVLANGDLAYFYNNLPDPPSGAVPLLLVCSGADGASGRNALRPEKLLLIDALWSPTGDLIVTVQPPPGDPVWPPRGPLVVVFADGRPNQAVAPDGRAPKWGP